LFIQPRGLNGKVPLGMTKEINLLSGHKGSTKLTNRYAKLARVHIPTKVDTLTGEVDMIGSKHIMNRSDKLTRKVDLMKASESQGVDNSQTRTKTK
jgi:hypothetical protein